MHPPLERPHPKCQDAIHALNVCHAEKFSKILFWKCNEVKYELDRCFKEEKKEMLTKVNLKEGGVDHVRKQEDAVLEKGESFQDFLKRDPEYQKIRQESKMC